MYAMPPTESYKLGHGATTAFTPRIRSLYVHVPFCHTICGYCDFYSEVFDKQAIGPLVDSLLAELATYETAHAFSVDTIFVGGGTPTTLPPELLQKLLTKLASLADRDLPLEFTSEANPATVTPEVAAALVNSGVNRVSIGAQSFDAGELQVLERIHRPPQVAETIRIARAAGIDNVSIDLIFAVPGQSLASWMRNLDAALALNTDHLSCYGLTFEPGTPLHRQLSEGRVRKVDEDLEAEMYEATIERLAREGYRQYEVSNFARPGRECRHNLRYWNNDGYLGIGPSACGFLADRGLRYRNVPDTAAYVRAIRAGKSPQIESEELSREAQMRDAAWLGLRQNRGIDRATFRDRYAQDFVDAFPAAVEELRLDGLLEVDDATIRLTRRGLLLGNHVAARFL